MMGAGPPHLILTLQFRDSTARCMLRREQKVLLLFKYSMIVVDAEGRGAFGVVALGVPPGREPLSVRGPERLTLSSS
jgi:hypothetical protein